MRGKTLVEAGMPAAKATAVELEAELAAARRRTLDLIAPVPDEELRRQIRSHLSPLAWDLGHIADFEKLWLVDAVEGLSAKRLEQRFDALETPRDRRGGLELPDKDAACARLAAVRDDVLALLEELDPASPDPLLCDGYVYRMVLQHEAQHQETMLQALDMPEEGWGWRPDLADRGGSGDRRNAEGWLGESAAEGLGCVAADDELGRVRVDPGDFLMGTPDRARAYDNERPRHEVSVGGFEMERYPVTNRRWMRFIDDAGYRRAELWSEGGRAWLERHGEHHPQGWTADSGGWKVRRFGSELSVDPAEPVQHVSFWEAEAFARWSGGRLPTEAEWEKAASWGPEATEPRTYPWGGSSPGALSANGELRGDGRRDDHAVAFCCAPPRVGAYPERASAWGVQDLLGSVYQWTSSSFERYPGFEPFPYDEYSAVFFGRGYAVLRGASWAAAPILWRNTYRNWDLRQRRQIFAGVRVVYDG